jgi:LL-diaminopimelate aminotransferase
LEQPAATAFSVERTALFKKRRDRIAKRLEDLGFKFQLPRASYYFWVHIPEPYTSSVEFCADLLEKQGLVVTPGIGYGPSGETFFRVSMTAPDATIDQGLERLRRFMKENI